MYVVEKQQAAAERVVRAAAMIDRIERDSTFSGIWRGYGVAMSFRNVNPNPAAMQLAHNELEKALTAYQRSQGK